MKPLFCLLLISCLFSGAFADDGLSERKQRQIAAQFRKALHLEETCAQIKAGKVDPVRLAVIHGLLASTGELFIHRQRGADLNQVYVNDDGREAVFGPDKKPVADDINTATFNYFPARQDGVRHFFFDTSPWIAWGYSRKDPTTVEERISSYIKDLLGGIVLASREPKLSPVDVSALKHGEIETYAIFIRALQAGQAEELYTLINSHQIDGLPSIDPLLRKIESGLGKVYADAPRR